MPCRVYSCRASRHHRTPRPSAPDSGNRGEHRTPRPSAKIPATPRNRSRFRPVSLSGERAQPIRQAVATVRQSIRRPFNRAPVYPARIPASRGNIERRATIGSGRPLAGFVGNISGNRAPVATIERRAGFVASRHHQTCRAGFRPMSPDSARRPFNRCPFALQSRQPFDPRPLKSRRKRPCKPSARSPMSAPV